MNLTSLQFLKKFIHEGLGGEVALRFVRIATLLSTFWNVYPLVDDSLALGSYFIATHVRANTASKDLFTKPVK